MNLFVPRLALGVSLLVGACTPALVHTESPAQSMQLSQNSPEAMNPETFLDWGRQRTQIGDWQGAIANFQAAADGFAGQGDETRQAMAEAIVRYLDWWLGWSDRQRESAEVEMMPDWLSFGRCVEDQTGHASVAIPCSLCKVTRMRLKESSCYKITYMMSPWRRGGVLWRVWYSGGGSGESSPTRGRILDSLL